MMKIRFFIVSISLLGFIAGANAQEGKCPKLPNQYTWTTPEEYHKDEDLVKKTLKWLCATPLGIDAGQRSIANAYVMEWIAGAPNIRIEIETQRIAFYATQPDLLFSYIHGAALYKLEKNASCNDTDMEIKAYETVANLALQSDELTHDSSLKPLLKAYKKSKMKQYVASTHENKTTK
jgi:hypothetical protein